MPPKATQNQYDALPQSTEDIEPTTRPKTVESFYVSTAGRVISLYFSILAILFFRHHIKSNGRLSLTVLLPTVVLAISTLVNIILLLHTAAKVLIGTRRNVNATRSEGRKRTCILVRRTLDAVIGILIVVGMLAIIIARNSTSRQAWDGELFGFITALFHLYLARETSAGKSSVVVFTTEDHQLLQRDQEPPATYHDEEDVDGSHSEDHS